MRAPEDRRSAHHMDVGRGKSDHFLAYSLLGSNILPAVIGGVGRTCPRHFLKMVHSTCLLGGHGDISHELVFKSDISTCRTVLPKVFQLSHPIDCSCKTS